ncbi:uncharacterized protein K452DRAFT_279095 [Aplosporella prunicola CBS 121167]|uniref:Rhodopsin domain-containing protein n=1 Tax=Aplosporella prunicola CBS 121167 TaxID=1176127 RepID=A0A6A6B254_9PEZI|nr:uncharacterized protein K452DRAFT_279095 [Aplosporella prunicola CBS 121167]KAF2137097.1 hypothetical protein K452DRAFT_279095 [Aplosporella prunicola CBS 121167]
MATQPFTPTQSYLTGAAREEAILHQRPIREIDMIATSWTLYGVTTIVALIRFFVRVKSTQKLWLDDYLVMAAVLCSTASTALLYHWRGSLYLSKALLTMPDKVAVEPKDLPMLESQTLILDLVNAFIWTTIFSMKLSFLYLFRNLVKNNSLLLIRYFWFVVIFTVLSWGFSASEIFIHCHSFGKDSYKCNESNPTMSSALDSLATALDVATDLMVISIPIFVLRRAKTNITYKLAAGAFLCLSVVTIVVATIRLLSTNILEYGGLDPTWGFFWAEIEAYVSILATSATVFRFSSLRRAQLMEEQKHDSLQETSEAPSPVTCKN